MAGSTKFIKINKVGVGEHSSRSPSYGEEPQIERELIFVMSGLCIFLSFDCIRSFATVKLAAYTS